MQTILVDSGPPPISYRTFEEAVSGAEKHTAQEHARACASELSGARVVSGTWQRAACEIEFSNGRLLLVQANQFAVSWAVSAFRTIQPGPGPAAAELVWSTEIRCVFEPDSFLPRIVGADFDQLFVNEVGLLLYTAGNPILWFRAFQNRESHEDLLYAVFE